MRLTALKSILVGTALVCAAPMASALTVQFEGVAFNQGGSATVIHNAQNLWRLDGQPAISYEGTENPVGQLEGATAVFGTGTNDPMRLELSDINAGFDAVLLLGTSGAGSNTLTVGDDSNPLGTATNTPVGDVHMTHFMSGELNYRFEDTGGNLLGTGVFTFNEITSGSLFNRVGRATDTPDPFDIAAFLWGSAGTVDTSGCVTSAHCSAFNSLKHGLGMDLAFTGQVPPGTTAIEPGTLALVGLGLLGFARRRRAS